MNYLSCGTNLSMTETFRLCSDIRFTASSSSFKVNPGQGNTMSVAPACATSFKFAGVETSGTRSTPRFINGVFDVILGAKIVARRGVLYNFVQ